MWFVPRKKVRQELPEFHIDTIIDVGGEEKALFIVQSDNTPGILSKVSNVFAEEHLNIYKVGVPEPARSETAFFYVIVDDCNKECAEKMKMKISSLAGVKHVEVFLPVNGYIIPEYKTVKFLDKDALIFTADVIGKYAVSLITGERGGIVPGAVDLTYLGRLRLLGKAIGETIYEYLSNYIPEEVENIEETYTAATHLLQLFLRAMGFGRVTIRALTVGREYIVTFHDGAPECRALSKYHFNNPTGNLTQGILEGFFERMTSRRTIAGETECINKLKKNCVFHVEIMEYRPGY